MKIKHWIIRNIIRPKWVAFRYHDSSENQIELGISIFGVVIGLYKGNPIYPSNPVDVRAPGKYEFGESLFTIEEIKRQLK